LIVFTTNIQGNPGNEDLKSKRWSFAFVPESFEH